MQAYCVKCRAKVEIKNPQAITFKNGRPATQGVCHTCGTKVFRIRIPKLLPSRMGVQQLKGFVTLAAPRFFVLVRAR
ncbi:MAG: hypothetical protein DDT26_01999 [Dehalococcoidia bacterium]|nr:hypothetical protein [Chloroflexota bacterium]